MLAILTGLSMLALGLLIMGRLFRFVPNSVLPLHSNPSSTMLDVIGRYAKDLNVRQSLLTLAGVDRDVMVELGLRGLLRKIGRRNVFEKHEVVGEAGLSAHEAATIWIEERLEGEPN